MRPLRPTIALLLAAALLATTAPAGAAPPSARVRRTPSPPPSSASVSHGPRVSSNVADNRVLVSFKGPVTADKLGQVYASTDTTAGDVSVVRGSVIAIAAPPSTTASEFAQQLDSSGVVATSSPNYLRPLAAYTPDGYLAPNDPAYLDKSTWGYRDGSGAWTEKYVDAKSWWIRTLGAVPSWANAYTGPNIAGRYPLRAPGTAKKVAVIDTGFYSNHPDIGSNVIAAPGTDATPIDPHLASGRTWAERVATSSHGTCVSGEIAAAAANGIGTLGIANDTEVVVYKVYFGGAGISDDRIIQAVQQAADDGCKVINLSIAGGDYDPVLQSAIDYAWSRGCIIVAASGNDGVGRVSYPAAMNHVLAVGGLGRSADGNHFTHVDFANWGSALDISAPGTWVWGLTKPDFDDPENIQNNDSSPGYRWWDGTSMASPIVAGGIAWLWRLAPMLSNAEMVSLVENSASGLGAPGRDNLYGYGAFNIQNAYAKLRATYPLLARPKLTIASESNARNTRVTWSAVRGYKVTYTVVVDGNVAATGLTSLGYTLPHDTTIDLHTVNVTAVSPRSWADGSESATTTVAPTFSAPQVTSLRYYRGKLLWSDTETGRAGTVRSLTVDGVPRPATGGVWSTTALARGSHAATLTVTDDASVASTPVAVSFVVRPSPTLWRVSAKDAPGFAAAESRATFPAAETVVLAGDAAWSDALAAAPLAHLVGGPVLLTHARSVPASTLSELRRLHTKRIIVVGGSGSVSAAVTHALMAKHYTVSRIGGSSSFAVADSVARAVVARTGGRARNGRAVVVGLTYASALPASAVAARKGWPLLFSGTTSVPSTTRKTLSAIGVTSTVLVANSWDVSAHAATQLPSVKRIAAASWLGVAPALANWATSTYPSDFSGERVALASATLPSNGAGLGAAAARLGTLVLLSPTSLNAETRGYFSAHSEIAVTTRVFAGRAGISDGAVRTLKGIVGAP